MASTLLEEVVKFKHPIVVPTDEELAFMQENGKPLPNDIPIAVRVQKFSVSDMSLLTVEKDLSKLRFENICKNYPQYEFIFYFQFKEGYKLTSAQLTATEEIQNINKTKFRVCYEPYTAQNSKKFMELLDDFAKRNVNKIVIPLLDAGEKDLSNLTAKALYVVKQDYKICGVISRHHLRKGWKLIMPILKEAGIFVIVLGVYPRYTFRNEKNEYSLLVPPLLLGANVVSHGMAWSGGPSKTRFLQNDWIYHYAPEMPSSTKNYRLSRAEAVISANNFCKQQLSSNNPLSLISYVEGFSYFADEMGISNVRRLKDYL